MGARKWSDVQYGGARSGDFRSGLRAAPGVAVEGNCVLTSRRARVGNPSLARGDPLDLVGSCRTSGGRVSGFPLDCSNAFWTGGADLALEPRDARVGGLSRRFACRRRGLSRLRERPVASREPCALGCDDPSARCGPGGGEHRNRPLVFAQGLSLEVCRSRRVPVSDLACRAVLAFWDFGTGDASGQARGLLGLFLFSGRVDLAASHASAFRLHCSRGARPPGMRRVFQERSLEAPDVFGSCALARRSGSDLPGHSSAFRALVPRGDRQRCFDPGRFWRRDVGRRPDLKAAAPGGVGPCGRRRFLRA